MDTKMAFAALLKQLCEDAGLQERGRQAALVRLLKQHGITISQPAVKKYFDGEALPDMDKALVLANAFDYNVNDLLAGVRYTTEAKKIRQLNQSPVTYNNWPFGDKVTPDEYNSLTPRQKEMIVSRVITYLDDNSKT